MSFLLLGLLSLTTLVLYGINFTFRFYSHFMLSMLVHGVSGGKVYFLLIYSTVVFGMLHFRTGKGNRWGPLARRLGMVALFLGMGASFGSYMHYITEYDLPVEAYHYHFKGIYNSVNYFPHIHTSKVFLYRVGSIFGLEKALGNMDDGRAFVNVIPAFYSYLTLLSFLLLFSLSLLIIPEIVHRWEGRNKVCISILSVFSFNSIIKCLSDGGPLAYDFLVGVGILSILAYAKSPVEIKAFLRRRWRVFLWVSVGILLLEFLIDPSLGIMTYTLDHGVLMLVFYCFIYLLAIRNGLKSPILRWSFLAALTLILSYAGATRYSVYVKPFLADLDEGTEIHYFDYGENRLPERLNGSRVIFDSGFLSIYRFSIAKKEKVLHLYKELGENPYRNRHIAIIRPKKSKAYGILAKIIFLEFERRDTVLRIPGIFDLKLKGEDLERE
ncbi:MAG TPA: hypothetical protein VLZ03_05940, partial [Thermodesulfobacteriota bacterium]|nr:hypothetical protein [Thermodesulfobacteriota bacterium]